MASKQNPKEERKEEEKKMKEQKKKEEDVAEGKGEDGGEGYTLDRVASPVQREASFDSHPSIDERVGRLESDVADIREMIKELLNQDKQQQIRVNVAEENIALQEEINNLKVKLGNAESRARAASDEVESLRKVLEIVVKEKKIVQESSDCSTHEREEEEKKKEDKKKEEDVGEDGAEEEEEEEERRKERKEREKKKWLKKKEEDEEEEERKKDKSKKKDVGKDRGEYEEEEEKRKAMEQEQLIAGRQDTQTIPSDSKRARKAPVCKTCKEPRKGHPRTGCPQQSASDQ